MTMDWLSLDKIIKTHGELAPAVLATPLLDGSEFIDDCEMNPGSIRIKPELFQRSGSFKFRGAMNAVRHLTTEERKHGIVAFSGGNHAIAVAYVARAAGISAKVVMPESASPRRILTCKSLGAEVFLVKERADAPRLAQTFVESEGRSLIPPFEHEKTILGTASLGYELIHACPDLDIVLVAVGGGGLAAGVAAAIKQVSPRCKVYGVQPPTADAMSRSLKSGMPESNIYVNTVADSLCPPTVGALTLKVCQRYLDDMLIVDEANIRQAMNLLNSKLQLVVEGAGAVPLACLLSGAVPGSESSKIGFIIGGSSIDLPSFESQIENL